MNSEFFSANYSHFNRHYALLARFSTLAINFRTHIFYLGLLLFSPHLLATDYYQENKTNLDLQASLPQSEILWLSSNEKTKTLTLNRPAISKKTLGTIILLSDINQHPDWPGIIHSLRTTLPRHGWRVLSVQMPYSNKNTQPISFASIQTSIQNRVKAAIDLISTESQNIIIIAHRHSANATIQLFKVEMEYQQKINAFVGISLFDSPQTQTSQLLRNVYLPFLDIFAQKDTIAVLNSAPLRLESARFTATTNKASPYSAKVTALAINKSGNLNYRQTTINGAYEDFSGHTDTLVKAIRGWINQYAANS